MPLESTIVSVSMESAEARGWIAVKMHGSSYSPRGFPDVMYFRDGVTKFVEYKQPGKEPTAVQKLWHAKLRAKGFAVAVIDRAKDTEAFLEATA